MSILLLSTWKVLRISISFLFLFSIIPINSSDPHLQQLWEVWHLIDISIILWARGTCAHILPWMNGENSYLWSRASDRKEAGWGRTIKDLESQRQSTAVIFFSISPQHNRGYVLCNEILCTFGLRHGFAGKLPGALTHNMYLDKIWTTQKYSTSFHMPWHNEQNVHY